MVFYRLLGEVGVVIVELRKIFVEETPECLPHSIDPWLRIIHKGLFETKLYILKLEPRVK
jgi:hypothetical protein